MQLICCKVVGKKIDEGHQAMLSSKMSLYGITFHTHGPFCLVLTVRLFGCTIGFITLSAFGCPHLLGRSTQAWLWQKVLIDK